MAKLDYEKAARRDRMAGVRPQREDRPFRAKYPGTCYTCGKPIKIGNQIVLEIFGASHSRCAM